MAQSPGCNLKVDEAHPAENVAAVDRICPSYEESEFDVEAMIGEIRGFLQRYAAARSLDLRKTQVLTTGPAEPGPRDRDRDQGRPTTDWLSVVHGELFILRSQGQQRALQSCLPCARQDMLQL
jgi:hypothetical protein